MFPYVPFHNKLTNQRFSKNMSSTIWMIVIEILIHLIPQFILWDEDVTASDPFGIIQNIQDIAMERSFIKIQLFRRTRIRIEEKIIRNQKNTREFSASKIQNKWRRVISNPNTSICKRRLLFEFSQLSGKPTSHSNYRGSRWVQHHHGCWRI